MATSEDRKRKERPPADKYSVGITVSEQTEVKDLVRERGLDLVQTQVLEGGKRFRLTFFLTEDEIKELRKGGYSLEVGENVSELGLKRQTEVAKGDRFDGGRIAPKGLGVLRRPGQEGPK